MASTHRTAPGTPLQGLIDRKETALRGGSTWIDFDHLTDVEKAHWLDLANAARLALTTFQDLTSEQFSRGADQPARLALTHALDALGLTGRS